MTLLERLRSSDIKVAYAAYFEVVASGAEMMACRDLAQAFAAWHRRLPEMLGPEDSARLLETFPVGALLLSVLLPEGEALQHWCQLTRSELPIDWTLESPFDIDELPDAGLAQELVGPEFMAMLVHIAALRVRCTVVANVLRQTVNMSRDRFGALAVLPLVLVDNRSDPDLWDLLVGAYFEPHDEVASVAAGIALGAAYPMLAELIAVFNGHQNCSGRLRAWLGFLHDQSEVFLANSVEQLVGGPSEIGSTVLQRAATSGMLFGQICAPPLRLAIARTLSEQPHWVVSEHWSLAIDAIGSTDPTTRLVGWALASQLLYQLPLPDPEPLAQLTRAEQDPGVRAEIRSILRGAEGVGRTIPTIRAAMATWKTSR